MSNIKVFKLISGEEVIAEVVQQLQPTWTIRKARGLHIQQTQAGHIGIGMIPWLAGNVEGEVEIRETALMTNPYDPEANLEKEYLQQTTGIAIAT